MFNVVPSFVSSLSSSSTADEITIMVDVNDQYDCMDQDTLTIMATITDGDGSVIDTRESADFTDGPITFGSVSVGEFTCTVTIVDGMGPIESQEISCGISPTSK